MSIFTQAINTTHSRLLKDHVKSDCCNEAYHDRRAIGRLKAYTCVRGDMRVVDSSGLIKI